MAATALYAEGSQLVSAFGALTRASKLETEVRQIVVTLSPRVYTDLSTRDLMVDQEHVVLRRGYLGPSSKIA